LNDEPGWRQACVTLLNCESQKLKPPDIATTRPVCGSIATSDPVTSGIWRSV
jgi:hypothetical protein